MTSTSHPSPDPTAGRADLQADPWRGPGRAGQAGERAATLADVLEVLEARYPAQTAQSWDQVGLVAGDPGQSVRRVHFAVDPTLAVIEEAREAGADLLITHHPLLLRGVHSVATTSAKGAAVTALVVADLALYVAHTNADIATPGVNTALAAACGLEQTRPLSEQEGRAMGLVGDLSESISLREFAARLASRLPAAPVGLRVAGPPYAPITRIALLGGAGDSLFGAVRAARADVYVTSDLRHHPASEAREEARGGPPYLIDAGHWATEWLWLREAADALAEAMSARRASVDTHVSTLCTDPWDAVVSTTGGGGGPDESTKGAW